jgi:hypothetical protein
MRSAESAGLCKGSTHFGLALDALFTAERRLVSFLFFLGRRLEALQGACWRIGTR